MNQAQPIILERTFNASAGKLWQALTDSSQMKQWYFDIPGFKAEPGFEFTFEGGDECQTYEHLCRVTEAVPQQKLAYSWRYAGYPGDSRVTFGLYPEGDKTRLKLTHAGLETFPADIKAFARENFVAGWNAIIGTSLQEFLEKTPVPSA